MTDSNQNLIQSLAEALEPVIQRVFERALENVTLEFPEKDIILLDEVCEETDLAKQTIYQQTSEKWQRDNPGRGVIPHYKRGNKLYFSRKAVRAWMLNGKSDAV